MTSNSTKRRQRIKEQSKEVADYLQQMTDNNHPISPPLPLVQQWIELAGLMGINEHQLVNLATQAARWGADQELKACCEWLKTKEWIHPEFSDELRDLRRPGPPSLKEQALDELHLSFDKGYLKEGAADTIRRALESLPD